MHVINYHEETEVLQLYMSRTKYEMHGSKISESEL